MNGSDITKESIYLHRRKFIAAAVSLLGTSSAFNKVLAANTLDEQLTSLHDITHYNNYYEFSTNKEAIAILAQDLAITPWEITIGGEVEKPLVIDVSQLLNDFQSKRFVYPLRCVEGWSMVIPWQGFQLQQLLEKVKPTANAKYVKFNSLFRPSEMIGQRRNVLEWPYVEGLRLDEAMHPLTILATGLYDKPLPKQNGAPLRLVVPWKYGFKSIKAITSIELTAEMPTTSWMKSSPSEYGFYANVNPTVAHPRWSQRREVRIGELKKRKTKMFNGFENQVADLYKGMDLEANF